MPSADINLRSPVDMPSRFDFDALAEWYDRWYETAEGAMYDRLEKKVVSKYLPADAKAMKLLDVGCGTGHWSRFFSEHGFKVTGIDVSERMIKIAQGKNIAGASFLIADAHSLPFADESFDVAAAITTLEFVREPEQVLREMVRCTCKRRGRILIGMLNPLARLNRNRQRNPESLYAKARLFSPWQLKQLLEQYGQTHITTGGFVPKSKLLLPLSPFIDVIGRLLHLPYGVFIAAEVRL